MRIISEPEIYLIGRQSLDQHEVRRFLEDQEHIVADGLGKRLRAHRRAGGPDVL